MEPNLLQVFASYTSWKCSEDTWIINFMGGSQNMYLLEGKYGALLIDTGWGSGTLRAYVESLTDKPVQVLLTHGHLDHSGSAGEWESVLMLPGAVADLATLGKSPFNVSKLPYPNYEKKFVTDGEFIDLGDRSVQLLDISAHSNGSVAVLDQKNGYLFVGDEVESSQVLMYDAAPESGVPFVLNQRLRAHHANMLRLKKLEGLWKTIFPAHNGAPIAPSYLDDYIALVEHIYTGDAAIEDKLNHPHVEAGDPEHRMCRVRWGKASFFVVKEDLIALWGTGLQSEE